MRRDRLSESQSKFRIQRHTVILRRARGHERGGGQLVRRRRRPGSHAAPQPSAPWASSASDVPATAHRGSSHTTWPTQLGSRPTLAPLTRLELGSPRPEVDGRMGCAPSTPDSYALQYAQPAPTRPEDTSWIANRTASNPDGAWSEASFRWGAVLGRGKFGEVQLVRAEKDQLYYAVKSIPKEVGNGARAIMWGLTHPRVWSPPLPSPPPSPQVIWERQGAPQIQTELDMLSSLSTTCPFICECFGSFQDDKSICILVEYVGRWARKRGRGGAEGLGHPRRQPRPTRDATTPDLPTSVRLFSRRDMTPHYHHPHRHRHRRNRRRHGAGHPSPHTQVLVRRRDVQQVAPGQAVFRGHG